MEQTKQSKLVVPTVHRNGTGKQDLLDMRRDFSNALHQAIVALERMHPNARDYREGFAFATIPSFSEAVDQHQLRCTMLFSLRQEIEDEQESILDS